MQGGGLASGCPDREAPTREGVAREITAYTLPDRDRCLCRDSRCLGPCRPVGPVVFFVPFLNLVRPYQVMNEVWMGTARLFGGDEAKSWNGRSSAPHVGLWWALFLATSFLGRASGRLMPSADELGEWLTAGQVTLAADLMDIPAALVALLLVRRLTDLQEQARTRPRARATESAY